MRAAPVAVGLSTLHILPFYRNLRLVRGRFASRPRRLNLNTGEILEPTNTVQLHDALPFVREQGSAEVWVGGNLVQCKRPYSTSTDSHSPGGLRGRILGFSKAARRNIMRTVARVRIDCLPLFVTMTYPGKYPTSGKFYHKRGEVLAGWMSASEQWKRDLSAWIKRLRRRCSRVAVLWKLEPQKRGAPHFHLLLWGVDENLDEFRDWCSEAWYEVVGSEDERHLRAGTRVERARSSRGTMYYVSKYIAKLPDPPAAGEDIPDWSAGVGRWWGIRYERDMPWADKVTIPLTARAAFLLMDALIEHAGFTEGVDRRTLTVFAVGSEWLDWLRKMGALVDS